MLIHVFSLVCIATAALAKEIAASYSSQFDPSLVPHGTCVQLVYFIIRVLLIVTKCFSLWSLCIVIVLFWKRRLYRVYCVVVSRKRNRGKRKGKDSDSSESDDECESDESDSESDTDSDGETPPERLRERIEELCRRLKEEESRQRAAKLNAAAAIFADGPGPATESDAESDAQSDAEPVSDGGQCRMTPAIIFTTLRAMFGPSLAVLDAACGKEAVAHVTSCLGADTEVVVLSKVCSEYLCLYTLANLIGVYRTPTQRQSKMPVNRCSRALPTC